MLFKIKIYLIKIKFQFKINNKTNMYLNKHKVNNMFRILIKIINSIKIFHSSKIKKVIKTIM